MDAQTAVVVLLGMSGGLGLASGILSGNLAEMFESAVNTAVACALGVNFDSKLAVLASIIALLDEAVTIAGEPRETLRPETFAKMLRLGVASAALALSLRELMGRR